MVSNKEIHNHIISLFLLSLGGWLLHLRIHPLGDNPANYIPFIFGILNITIVPITLNYKKTFLFGYLVNGFGVISGIIIMTVFSLSALPYPVTFSAVVLRTLFAYNVILLSKLFIGQRIFYFYYATGRGRMFTFLWWFKHFIYLSIVFALGHFLWR